MPRKSAAPKSEPQKPGRKSDFNDDETALLTTFGERFQTGGGSTAFYTEVLRTFIEKFSYEILDRNKKGIPKVPALRLEEDLNSLPPDEKLDVEAKRHSARQTIRTKIGNWFRHFYNHRRKSSATVDQVLPYLVQLANGRPKKRAEWTVYSEMYYEEKLKHGFDTMWEGCLQGGMDSGRRINLLKGFINQNWSKETAEVRAAVKARCEAEFNEKVDAWKERSNWSGTAEEYQRAFEKIDEVLPPFTDALSKYMGMVAIVTLVGRSTETGEVVVRSIQSMSPKDQPRQPQWAEIDRPAYNAFQASLVRFGDGLFPAGKGKGPMSAQDSDIAMPSTTFDTAGVLTLGDGNGGGNDDDDLEGWGGLESLTSTFDQPMNFSSVPHLRIPSRSPSPGPSSIHGSRYAVQDFDGNDFYRNDAVGSTILNVTPIPEHIKAHAFTHPASPDRPRLASAIGFKPSSNAFSSANTATPPSAMVGVILAPSVDNAFSLANTVTPPSAAVGVISAPSAAAAPAATPPGIAQAVTQSVDPSTPVPKTAVLLSTGSGDPPRPDDSRIPAAPATEDHIDKPSSNFSARTEDASNTAPATDDMLSSSSYAPSAGPSEKDKSAFSPPAGSSEDENEVPAGPADPPPTGSSEDETSAGSSEDENEVPTGPADPPPTGSSEDETSADPPAGSIADKSEEAPTGSGDNEKEVAHGGVKRAARRGSKRKLATTDENRDPADEKGAAGGKRQRKATALKPLPPVDNVLNNPGPLLPRRNRGPAAYLKENGYVPPKKGCRSRKND